MVVMSTGIGQIQQTADKQQFLHYQQQLAKNQQAQQIQQKVSKPTGNIIS